MAKEGWLKFEDLMIPEDKIVAVTRKKNKVTIHLPGYEFSLSKSEGSDFWDELTGGGGSSGTDSGPIELIESGVGTTTIANRRGKGRRDKSKS